MLLERFTELYHRVHNSIDCKYMDQRSFRVRDQTMKGNANILLKAKNVNERRLRYLPVQEKVQIYMMTLLRSRITYGLTSAKPCAIAKAS